MYSFFSALNVVSNISALLLGLCESVRRGLLLLFHYFVARAAFGKNKKIDADEQRHHRRMMVKTYQVQ